MTDTYSGYGWSKTHIGQCDDGDIYSGSGWGKSQIGSYDGEDCGAVAAALFLFLEKDKLIGVDYEQLEEYFIYIYTFYF